MKRGHRIGIFCVALLGFGALRIPLEASLTRELRTQNLLPPELAIGTRERIGQTSSAVALGGLRTLVATFLNLRAYTFFTEQRWQDVGDTYDTIVDLAPRTHYYWDTGSWHLAYNAASYYVHDSDLPALRRQKYWREYIQRGRAFLERGVRNNPGDWKMFTSLGKLLSDPNKFPAFSDQNKVFAAAADAYQGAVDTGDAPQSISRALLYALSRVPGRESDALALAEKLYHIRGNQNPLLLSIYFAERMHADPDQDAYQLAHEIFGNDEKAYEMLTLHWERIQDRFPVYGVAAAIASLESRLSIPPEKSVFNQLPRRPPSTDDWFTN